MGKPQHAESAVVTPAAKFVENAGFKNPEDVEEIAEQLKDMERKRQRESARATKVSVFLKDSFFRTDKTWPFLFWDKFKIQLSVRYFFPRKNLAIDQFKSPTKMELAAIEYKREKLKANGIKYFPMFAQHRLIDLAEYL